MNFAGCEERVVVYDSTENPTS